MIWLPLLENAPFKAHDWVLVDEAQDSNVARRMMAEKMLKKSGRLLAVGDRFQAIYGFSGASSDAVDRIIENHSCVQLPLTVTFRCSKAATKLAQTWVPHITAHEDNQEGRVSSASAVQFACTYLGDHRLTSLPENAVARKRVNARSS